MNQPEVTTATGNFARSQPTSLGGTLSHTYDRGLSAFEVAQAHGFKGDKQDWLNALKSPLG